MERIIVLPLFPQYASASTGSVQEKVMDIVKDWWVVPSISFISQFATDPGFIATIVARGRAEMDKQHYDHVVFSYHGIPERHVKKGDPTNYCRFGSCCDTLTTRQPYCYRAQCFATSRLVAAGLGLQPEQYTVAFQSRLQSRLRDPWLQPYTDEALKEMPGQRHQKRAGLLAPPSWPTASKPPSKWARSSRSCSKKPAAGTGSWCPR